MNYDTIFTEKEITLIAFAPAIAANGIAMVDGTISEEETLTISSHLLDATERYRHNKLIMLAIRSFTRLMKKGEMPGEMRYIRSPEEYLRTFRKVGKLIDKKIKNQEGAEYKHYLVDIMKSVASASGTKRKSFFGRGNVSDQEQQFLDHVSDILKIN